MGNPLHRVFSCQHPTGQNLTIFLHLFFCQWIDLYISCLSVPFESFSRATPWTCFEPCWLSPFALPFSTQLNHVLNSDCAPVGLATLLDMTIHNEIRRKLPIQHPWDQVPALLACRVHWNPQGSSYWAVNAYRDSWWVWDVHIITTGGRSPSDLAKWVTACSFIISPTVHAWCVSWVEQRRIPPGEAGS